MKKNYQKPEAEIISLLALENITTDDELVLDGSVGVADNTYFD